MYIYFVQRPLWWWNWAYMKCFVFFRMEECLHLVCETIGVHEEDEVGMDVICSLYKSVFLITASLEETKRAISQVNIRNAGIRLRITRMRRARQKREVERERNKKCLMWYRSLMCSGQRSEWRVVMFSQKSSACSPCDGETAREQRRGIFLI